MVPNGWSLKLISDTSKVITGNTPSTKIREYYGGNIPFVSPADLGGSKHISVATKKLTVEGFKKARSIRAGSTLFTCIGSTIGKLGMSATEVATNQQINAVVPYDKFDDDFIYYQLELRAVFIAKLAGTQAVPIINKTTFESQSLLVPDSLPEQRKIAKILSTWDKAISTTERLIDNSKQQKKALMQQLLTGAHTQRKRLLDDSGKPFEGEWEEVKLGDLFSLLKSGLSRKLLDENVGVAVIRSNNMGSQFTTNKDLKFWYADDPQGANTQNYLLDDGDILINFINSLSQIGKTCIFREIGDVKSIYTTNILRAKPNTSLVQRDYLFYLTKTQRYLSHIKAITKPAVNQASFTTKDFGNFTFKIPSLLEQQKIASVLNNSDKEIELLEQQLADLKQEKKALMQQLLTGKRRVKVDDKEVA
jgi:type I restriction enzyme S subunit